jgi:hypothetical protein
VSEEAFWLKHLQGLIGFRELFQDNNGADRTVNDKAILGWPFIFVGYNFDVQKDHSQAAERVASSILPGRG